MDATTPPSAFRKFIVGIRGAFHEFLAIPTAVLGYLVLLTVIFYLLDRSSIGLIQDLRAAISEVIFQSPSSTRATLSAIAGALITITSITFTVLLLAVQQAAAAMTTQILDQFIRRRLNQVFFGYFVGVSLSVLLVLASVEQSFNPILAASFVLLLTAIAIYLLAALVYITLTQVRPTVVLGGIHDGTLQARRQQLGTIKRMRSSPAIVASERIPVRSNSDGYAIDFDLDGIDKALGARRDEIEVILHKEFGSYITYDDVIAEIGVRGTLSPAEHERLSEAVRRCTKIARARDITSDPKHGIEEIMNIAWTTISSAKHSPIVGFHAADMLRDLLFRWVPEEPDVEPAGRPVPMVYEDTVVRYLLESLETLAVTPAESLQQNSYAAVLDAFTHSFDRMPADLQSHTAEIIRRIIPVLHHLVLTTQLDRSLHALIHTLRHTGYVETADAVEQARDQKAQSIGQIK